MAKIGKEIEKGVKKAAKGKSSGSKSSGGKKSKGKSPEKQIKKALK